MKRSKIFIKFFFVIALIMTLSMSILAAFFMTFFKNEFEDLLVTNSRESVLKITNQVSNNLEEMIAYGQIVAFDDSVQYALENIENGQDIYRYYLLVQNAKNTLKKYVNMKSNSLYDIVLISKKGEILEMNSNYDEFLKQKGFSAILGEKKNGFIPYRKYTYNINTGPWDTFSYVCGVYSKTNYQYIGKVMLIMKYDSMIRDPLEFDNSLGIHISIYNQEGTPMYTQDPGVDFRREYEEARRAVGFSVYRNSYYFDDDMALKGWHAIYFISGNYISQSINRIFAIMIFALLISVSLLLIVAYRLVKNMFRPLESIISAMRRVSRGEKGVCVSVHTGDEIEEAANVFNGMVAGIETNTKKLIDSQRRENETQIRMLIYQINPHFIYNTLNCVICLARGNDDEKIVVLVRTFIELLRSTLKSGVQSYVTIAEEMEYINRYMDVLRYSYRNIPEINWQVDEGLEKERILKQILYPLVENSVFHGILAEDEGGEIGVIMERNGASVEITEYDNGRGMTKEELAALRKSLGKITEEIVGGEHIGLQNVNNRLNLVYGKESRINVESEFGKGTLIFFRYPLG